MTEKTTEKNAAFAMRIFAIVAAAIGFALLLFWSASWNPPPMSYREAMSRIAPSVAGIYGGQARSRPHDNIGAGVAVESRHILTNYHLVANMNAIEANVNGVLHSAELVGVDPEIDIAILRIDGGKMPPAAFAEDSDLRQGDLVFAIGNPFGLGRSASMGIVSAIGRDLADTPHAENFIQTDAAINPGSSGGALANARGELVGINSALFARGPAGEAYGIGFAVPAGVVRRSLRDFLPQPPNSPPFGAEVRPMSARMHREVLDFVPDTTPVMLVSRIWPGTPAAKLDVRPGDIVLEINEKPPQGLSDTGALPPSLRTMIVLRGGERIRLSVAESDSE